MGSHVAVLLHYDVDGGRGWRETDQRGDEGDAENK